ncbi:MAG TPA: LuxR C-terminal-related transcriptional regulator [Sandaracinaceae bacterium]
MARGTVSAHPLVHAQSVRVNGLRLRFIEWRAAPTAHAGLASLPPSLRRVGELMARGLSDKEIANVLDLPVTTARTYAQRVLTRLGLDDRRKLMVLSSH